MKLQLSRQTFEKYLNIIFNEELSIANRVVPWGRTDMTKLIVALRNFANAPKIVYLASAGTSQRTVVLNPVTIATRTFQFQAFAQEIYIYIYIYIYGALRLYQLSVTLKNNTWLVCTVEL